MSQNLRNYTRGLYLLDAVCARVPEGAWDNPSCCEGWTARQAAGHAGWLIKNIGSLAAGLGTIAEQDEAEVLGADPAAGMRQIVHTTLAQLDQPGALATIATTPFGEMPIDNFIGAVWVDPLTHAWDVADATGIAHGIDQPTAEAALAQMRPIAEALRGPGRFDEAVPTDADDAVTQFIAYTGRTSVR